MNVQMVGLADQYISHVKAKFPGSVHDPYILRNSSIPYVMGQLQRHRVWLIGDSGYPNLSWLLTPVTNPRTRAEECYNEAHGRTRRIIERTFGLLKARFRCLHMIGGSLFYSPKKVCQIIVACCMLHNLALRRQVPFLQEDGPDGGVVAAVEPVDSEDEEAEEEDIDNRNSVILQYFHAAVCTANGIPRLKDRCVDSWVVIVWAYSCWRDGGGFGIASLSLTFGVADLCGCLNFGRFRAVGRNSCSGIPQWCVGGLLHGKADKAFLTLKKAFSTAPILAHPDTEHPFIVEADASDIAIRAVLSQLNKETGQLHPVAYMLRKLNEAEQNYVIAEKELLAIRDAFKEWRHYILGAKYIITVYTDHRDLQFMSAARLLTARQLRWMLFFAEFDFVVNFRPGKDNHKADALSRQDSTMLPTTQPLQAIIAPGKV
ncbi:hypothetical protein NDU88_007910 [Pleurodeles waltl]|uniref:Uncharacterized protein n=1 Tax=Pleurodeles waltl TaxID=8319 RepID=A0AAV7VVR2_PLEWA|nr:hypothetical protein NDU88_007910 [Pleurodeles waltl]